MRYIPFIFLIFILGCKSKPTENFKDCAVTFISAQKVPIIKGLLNGKTAYYIVDSGASISVLDESQSDDYNFSYHKESETEAAGYGGVASFNKASGANIEIGGVNMSGDYNTQDLSAIKSIIQRNEGITITGIIGCNIMAKKGLIIDLKNQKLYISEFVTINKV